MEYIETITATTTSSSPYWDAHMSSRVAGSYGDAVEHVNALIDEAEVSSDTPVKVTWTTFKDRSGRMVEKCAIESTGVGVRCTDVVWFKRGYGWF